MTFLLYRMLSLAVYLSLFVFFFLCLFFLLAALFQGNNRWMLARMRLFWSKPAIPPFILAILLVKRTGEKMEATRQLLHGCGLGWTAVGYTVVKRVVLLILAFCGILTWKLGQTSILSQEQYLSAAITFSLLAIAVCLDKLILDTVKSYRSQAIIGEIYELSKQLLYYSGSKMNLHSKLVRCIPHTKTIRNALYQLTNEWYQDPGMAIERFKERVGTEDGHQFAETMNSLRLYEHEDYYNLLKQRTKEYKEKLGLIRERKKESTSYILFVLAGIPILNTFRLFIYPWVAEGHKLFDSLG